MKKRKLTQLATASFLLLATSNCFAAGSGMPWETPLNRILDSITGPVVKALGVISIVLVGVAIASSEGGGFMRKVLSVVMGLCIAFSASTFFLDFFGYTSGLGF